jgi:hypothetical protein
LIGVPGARKRPACGPGGARRIGGVSSSQALAWTRVFDGKRWDEQDIEELVAISMTVDNPTAASVAAAARGVAALVDGDPDAARLFEEAADLAAGRLEIVHGSFRAWARIAKTGGLSSRGAHRLGRNAGGPRLLEGPF